MKKLMNQEIVDNLESSKNTRVIFWSYRPSDMSAIPEELRYHGLHLEDIYLKGNEITIVPNWIVELKNLSQLHLSQNNITSLPESIGGLRMLTVLNVSSNSLTEFPKSLSNLRNLKLLLANHIGVMKNLRSIELKHNQLERLPESLGELSNLETVCFDFNFLSTFPVILSELPKLQYISMTRNCFKYCPSVHFRTAPKLITDCNKPNLPMAYLPPPPRDRFLDLQKNQIYISTDKYSGMKVLSIMINDHRKEALLPFEHIIIEPLTNCIPTLQELALRIVAGLCDYHQRQNRRSIKFQIYNSLPQIFQKKIRNQRDSLCSFCGIPLFDYVMIKFVNNQYHYCMKFFCNKQCLDRMRRKEYLKIYSQD